MTTTQNYVPMLPDMVKALVECQGCRALIRNDSQAKAGHDRWHREVGK